MIYVDQQRMLTIAGGKWTTYRAMAEETIDRAVQEFGLRYVFRRLRLYIQLISITIRFCL